MDLNFAPLEIAYPERQQLITEARQHLSATEHHMPLVDLEALCPALCDELKRTFQSSFFRTRLFITPPKTETGIHVDGYSWESGTKWAVNFPVLGCKDTQFRYYEVDRAQQQRDRHHRPEMGNSIAMRFPRSAVIRELDWVEISAPTLVRTNVPHNVFNPNLVPRVILSVRFQRSLETEFEVELKRLQGLGVAK